MNSAGKETESWSSNDASVGRAVAFSVPILIGCIVLGWFFNTIGAIKASAHWPVSQGTVYRSRVDKRVSRDSRGSTRVSYEADIRYRYRVGKVTYKGNDFALDTLNTFPQAHEARNCVAAYPVGKKVNVRYDPRNPQIGCLMPDRVPFGMYIGSTLGFLFILGGAAAVAHEIRMLKRAKAAKARLI